MKNIYIFSLYCHYTELVKKYHDGKSGSWVSQMPSKEIEFAFMKMAGHSQILKIDPKEFLKIVVIANKKEGKRPIHPAFIGGDFCVKFVENFLEDKKTRKKYLENTKKLVIENKRLEEEAACKELVAFKNKINNVLQVSRLYGNNWRELLSSPQGKEISKSFFDFLEEKDKIPESFKNLSPEYQEIYGYSPSKDYSERIKTLYKSMF